MQFLTISLALAAAVNAAPIQLNNIGSGLNPKLGTTTPELLNRDDSLEGVIPGDSSATGGLIPELTGTLISPTGLKRDDSLEGVIPGDSSATGGLIPELTGTLISPTGLKRDDSLESAIPGDSSATGGLIPELTGTLISPTGLKRDDSLEGVIPGDSSATGGLIPELTGALISPTGLKRDEQISQDIPLVDEVLYEIDARDELDLENIVPELTSTLSATGLKRDVLDTVEGEVEDVAPTLVKSTGLKRTELVSEVAGEVEDVVPALTPTLSSTLRTTGLKRDEVTEIAPEVAGVLSKLGA